MTTAVVSPFFDFSEVINNKVRKKFQLDQFVLWNVDDQTCFLSLNAFFLVVLSNNKQQTTMTAFTTLKSSFKSKMQQ